MVYLCLDVVLGHQVTRLVGRVEQGSSSGEKLWCQVGGKSSVPGRFPHCDASTEWCDILSFARRMLLFSTPILDTVELRLLPWLHAIEEKWGGSSSRAFKVTIWILCETCIRLAVSSSQKPAWRLFPSGWIHVSIVSSPPVHSLPVTCADELLA